MYEDTVKLEQHIIYAWGSPIFMIKFILFKLTARRPAENDEYQSRPLLYWILKYPSFIRGKRSVPPFFAFRALSMLELELELPVSSTREPRWEHYTDDIKFISQPHFAYSQSYDHNGQRQEQGHRKIQYHKTH